MDLGNFIRMRKETLGLTDSDIADELGVSRSNVSRWQSGDIGKIAHRHIKPLARILKCNPMTFLQDNIEMPSNAVAIETQEVPLVGAIAAGQPIFAHEDFECYVEAGANIRWDFALRVKGDSMINARIFCGDIVFIRQQPDVDNGQIAAVMIDEEATLKRVYKYPDMLVLRSENPNFPELVYKGEELEYVRILGKAVAFQAYVR